MKVIKPLSVKSFFKHFSTLIVKLYPLSSTGKIVCSDLELELILYPLAEYSIVLCEKLLRCSLSQQCIVLLHVQITRHFVNSFPSIMQHSSCYNEFVKVFTHDGYFNVYKKDYAWSRIWTCVLRPQWIWSPTPEPLGYHSFEIHVYILYTVLICCIPRNLYSKIITLVFHRFLMKLGRWCHMLMICSGTWCYYSWITVYHTDTQGTGLLITWNPVRGGRLSSSYTCIYYQSLRVQNQLSWP